MNIAYFLTPKRDVAYLFDSATIRQGLEKMHRYGYTAIPVISRDGQYVGTVSEGDFLWNLLPEDRQEHTLQNLDELHIWDILRQDAYPPVSITVSLDDMFQSVMNQNFVPVVDDLGSFIGIVKRKDVIRYFIGAGTPMPGSVFQLWDNNSLRRAVRA